MISVDRRDSSGVKQVSKTVSGEYGRWTHWMAVCFIKAASVSGLAHSCEKGIFYLCEFTCNLALRVW